MDAALTILCFLPSVVFGVGTVITVVALRRAPTGLEDEEGFHYLRSSHTPLPENSEKDAREVSSAGAYPA